MKKIQDNDADIMALDTGQAYFGGRYYNMMPILAEKYSLVTDDTGKLQKIWIFLDLLLQWNELSLMNGFFFARSWYRNALLFCGRCQERIPVQCVSAARQKGMLSRY